jgi:hypothetical protein
MKTALIWKCTVCGEEIINESFAKVLHEMKIHAKTHDVDRPMDIFNVKRDENNLVMRAGA